MTWSEYIAQHGQLDTLTQHFVPHHPPASQTPQWSWLSHVGLLRIEGPDTDRFLQGQFTCDMKALTNDNALLGACCTPKGRMVANFVIARSGDGVLLRMPMMQVDRLIEHLSRYAVFFKATMSNVSHDVNNTIDGIDTGYVVLATFPANDSTVPPHTEALALEKQSTTLPNTLCIHWPDGRNEYWLPSTRATELAEQLTREQYALDASSKWVDADIELGCVWVDANQPTQWVPQHIHWHTLGGVSFSKGCYTGQEIIARTQYLGKSAKRLLLLHAGQAITPTSTRITELGKPSPLGDLIIWQGQHGLALATANSRDKTLQIDNTPVTSRELFYTEESIKDEPPAS